MKGKGAGSVLFWSQKSSFQIERGSLSLVDMNEVVSPEARALYWRRNLQWLSALLVVWFLVSYGCGVLWVDWLDQFTIPGTGFKLGFWFAQQGSIYDFVVLIAMSVVVMNKLDRQLLQERGTK